MGIGNKDNKISNGFTLVELVVVITILSALASIAFISIGNVTGDARNTKRKNDLSSISTAVRNIVEIKGMPITNAVSDTSSGRVKLTSGYSIAGRDIGDSKLDYRAGDVNYDQIQIKKASFQDPNGIPYIIGATRLSGQVFELATSLELPGNKYIAYVVGTYVPRSGINSDNSLSGVIDESHLKITLQNDIDVGKFKIGDIITTKAGFQNAEIINISNDGKTLTYTPVAASGFDWISSGATINSFTGGTAVRDLYLGSFNITHSGSVESAGLIMGASSPVVSESQTNLPYGGENGGVPSDDPPADPSNSCTTNPSFANIGTLSTGSPTSIGQTWTYSSTPGNCTYTCANGYSGNGCSPNSCAPNPSFTNIGTLTTGSPIMVSQTWYYSSTPGNCTYTCASGYSGEGCAGTCGPNPSNSVKVAGEPSATNTPWQSTNPGAACYFQCNANYNSTGTNCTPATQSCVGSNFTGIQSWNGSDWGVCTYNGTCDAGYKARYSDPCDENTCGLPTYFQQCEFIVYHWDNTLIGACIGAYCDGDDGSGGCISHPGVASTIPRCMNQWNEVVADELCNPATKPAVINSACY